MKEEIKPRLPKNDFVPYAPEEPGTIHKHHCKLGRNNDRLYITRKDDGIILAYCHHCGLGGYYRLLGSRTLQSRDKTKKSTEGSEPVRDGLREFREPPSGDPSRERDDRLHRSFWREKIDSTSEPALRNQEGDGETWPHHPQKWWLECGLTFDEARRYGVTYDWEKAALILPVYNRGKMVGQNEKHFRPGRPKYILRGSSVQQPIYPSDSGDYRRLVIVEDQRSAFKVAKILPAMPLLGTVLKDEHISFCLNFQEVIVFLDNDNPTVVRHARAMEKRLTNFGLCVKIIAHKSDPKDLSERQLREILDWS